MFTEKKITELNLNPYTLFAEEWAALSTGNAEDGYNAMTIAWGTLGALWEKKSHANRLPVLTVFVRPSRYTDTLMSGNETFTVAVLGRQNKKALGYLGSHSGRDTDKYKGAGLTPVFTDSTVYPEEAEMVFICKKLYRAPLQETAFCEQELLDFNYPEADIHNMYIGQIEKVLVKE